MTKDVHDALRARTVADMHAMVAGYAIHPPIINLGGHFHSMAQVQDDGDGRGSYALDRDGRRWLLDGSGDVA